MIEALKKYIEDHRDIAYIVLRRYLSMERPFLLRSDLWDAFKSFCEETSDKALLDSPLSDVIFYAQEATINNPWIYLFIRPRVASWHYLRINIEQMGVDEISSTEFLKFKESLVDGWEDKNNWALEIDLAPFERDFPKLKEPRSIGRGVEFLNRRLSSQLFHEINKGDRRLLEFLRVHHCKGKQLMINNRIQEVEELQNALRWADEYLAQQNSDDDWEVVGKSLQILGFEQGWGSTVKRMRESFNLLSDILEAPEPGNLERFLGRIPMIFNIVILSPHGYFG